MVAGSPLTGRPLENSAAQQFLSALQTEWDERREERVKGAMQCTVCWIVEKPFPPFGKRWDSGASVISKGRARVSSVKALIRQSFSVTWSVQRSHASRMVRVQLNRKEDPILPRTATWTTLVCVTVNFEVVIDNLSHSIGGW